MQRVSGIFGLALVFMPNGLLELYGSPPMNPPGIYNSMILGGFLIGFAVMNWAASGDGEPGARKYAILGGMVSNAVALLAALSRQLTPGGAQPTGWVNVGIFLVFAVLFAYLYFGRKAGTRLHATGRHGTAS